MKINRQAPVDKAISSQAKTVKKTEYPTPPNGGLKRDESEDQQTTKTPAVESSPVSKKTPAIQSSPVAKKTAAVQSSPAGASVATPSGNFIKSDQSLVMQSGRSKLYSEKYRDGIVNRILTEKTTIGEVRESLGLSEYDVIQWIKQAMDRKTERITELKRQVTALKKNQPLHLSEPKEVNGDFPTTAQFSQRESEDADSRSDRLLGRSMSTALQAHLAAGKLQSSFLPSIACKRVCQFLPC